MAKRVDLFDSTYSHFSDRVLDAIRKDTYGVDIGQNSWTTADEYDRFIEWLNLRPGARVLEVASGSGGPAHYLAGKGACHVTGIDSNEAGVATALRLAREAGDGERVDFRVADATAPLPFPAESFDALICIDSMNHFPDRLAVLREWQRVLRAGGRALFTDPVVITGPVTNDEIALRSSIGLFVFVPAVVTQRFVEDAALSLLREEDATGNAALTAGRWHRAREARRGDLLRIEGEERYEGLQRFFATVHRLTSERRLSRFVYLVEKPAGSSS
jgi:SAM-dependent methyltransferase